MVLGHRSLEVWVRLLGVLSEIYTLTIVVNCCLMLRQVLS